MTEKLEPDEKTIASVNASLEKCWNDAENPLPYIPLVVPPIEVPEFNPFGNGKEWHTEREDGYTTPASTPRDTQQADEADGLDLIMGQSLNNMMMEEQRKPVPEILWGGDGNGNALWFENEFGILFGRTNTGKSLYAVQIAEHISGELGKTVLYLDLELSMKQFQERYTSRDGELHVWPDNLHRPDLSMIGDGLYDSGRFLPLIRRMMAKVNARVLLLDNLTFLVNNGGMKAEDVKPICQEFCNWAKEGYSILVVNHTPKIQPFTPLDINHCLGSSMLTNFVQSVFAIGTDSSNPSTGRYVKQLKSRNGRIVWDGNRVIPYVIDKTLDPTMLRFIQPAQLHQTGMETSTPTQTARECDLLRDADNMQLEQIRKLHEQGMSNRKIAEKLNLSPATIGKRLKGMDVDGKE
ncbi:AAA family ATPase [Bacteroides sp. CACC 737]|uniref:AAA family ATPase n=1 Tax=Bacteroides sp. CACC 737 TaxID=2755405 RepID=UPI0015EEEFDD|nr:AAA family ATPase [Bacteroides sp. CACC 737]QMI81280.1 AAA family ATPase [Bacteroides sp. CACC 737]